MNPKAHPLNSVIRSIWRASGMNIDMLSTCINLGGMEFTLSQAHGVFHQPEDADYHELSLSEFKAALRGLIGWERSTLDLSRNRFAMGFTGAMWHAYELAHQAWLGEPVDWNDFKFGILQRALDEQNSHWRNRGRDFHERRNGGEIASTARHQAGTAYVPQRMDA